MKFIIHGGSEVPMGDELSYRWNQELFAANGYVVIWIAFHGTPGYGQKFIDAINGDWGGAPLEDLWTRDKTSGRCAVSSSLLRPCGDDQSR